MSYVLLVEDNDDHALLAGMALSGSNHIFEVERAKNADECFSMIQTKHYDVIVLDYSLPKKNGLEILQYIAGISYDTPVIMVTSQGDEKIAVEAMKCGAYDYVIKSEDYIDRLPMTVQNAVKSHKLEKEGTELQSRIKESELRLRNIFEKIEAGVVEADSDCRVIYANPKAKNYLNINYGVDTNALCAIFSKKETDSIVPDCTQCAVKQCFQTGEPINCEVEFSDRQFSASITSVYKSEGIIKGVILVLIDVTDQKKFQQQLIQSERINVLGRMASGVAHKFNNVLAVIMGRTELMLANQTIGEDIRKELRIIQKVAEDGTEAIRRLQEFTRVAKQKEFVKLNVDDIVQEALSMTEPSWKDQTEYYGVKVNVVPNLNSQAIILGNSTDLKEAFAKIIFNAVDAMPYGGTLSVETYTENGCAYIKISDTGAGIEPETLEKIFEPFFTTKGSGHSGLGLSIAYGIINKYDGGIDVKSTPEKGTTFTVVFDIYDGVLSEDEKPLPSSDQSVKAKILAIDDDVMIREILSNILIHLEHEVTAVADGTEGIRLYQSGNYDIVFTDLGMPGISGWEVAHKVKEIDPNAVIVMITGWSSELNEDELKDKNVDFIVDKPFKIERIAEVVSKGIELRGLDRMV